MKGKKALDFILLRPVFNQKNLTTVVIVIVLMGAYMMISGQRAFNLPAFDSNGTFGNLSTNLPPVAVDPERAKEILGVNPKSERDQRLENTASRDLLYGPDSHDDVEPVKHELGYNFEQQKKWEESELRKNELRKKDSLDTIAKRLRISR
jgi:hypothetical protein